MMKIYRTFNFYVSDILEIFDPIDYEIKSSDDRKNQDIKRDELLVEIMLMSSAQETLLMILVSKEILEQVEKVYGRVSRIALDLTESNTTSLQICKSAFT